MTKRAWIYVGTIFLVGIWITFHSFKPFNFPHGYWLLFSIFTFLASTAQLFKSKAPTHQLYHPALVFLFAGLLSLPFPLFVLQVIISHLVEWGKERLSNSTDLRCWYIQPFNICMHILSGYLASWVFVLINPEASILVTKEAMIAAVIAAVVYVAINHFVVGEVLMLARKISWRESDILNLENIFTDLIMLLLGFIISILAKNNIWLILPALTPIYPIYRSLLVPNLKRQANIDSKTGLWNASYFVSALQSEMARSRRYNRPLSVIVADLDLLRNINNSYGHLAGDVVLIEIARILKNQFREYDVVSRFGGEEFAILLPETDPEDAYVRAEGARLTILGADFYIPTIKVSIKATISFGIAGIGEMDNTPQDVIHKADLSVYEAKMEGRNQSCIFSETSLTSLSIRNIATEAIGRVDL